MADPDYETFVHDTIMERLINDKDEDKLRRACNFYGVNLKKFKEEHSEEIVFALLKK